MASSPLAKSMKGTYEMCDRATSMDLRSVTFSQALADGLSHSDWLDGRKIDRSGREVALASHSVSRDRVEENRTSVTYGPLFAGSSPSADLQSSLESRLHRSLDVNGSPEYGLTWKCWDMKSGPPISALRASARRTSGRGCGGWATPTETELGNDLESYLAMKRNMKSGARTAITHLSQQAQTAGWTTPQAHDVSPRGSNQKTKHGTKHGCADLNRDAAQTTGQIPSGGPAGTGSGDECQLRLNFRFVGWIMGYPRGWAVAGLRSMKTSSRSSARKTGE